MSGTTSDGSHPHARAVHVERGEPSDEELAALTLVLTVLAEQDGTQRAAAHAAAPTSPRSAWASPAHRLRAPVHCGPDAWRISAFPH